MAKKSAQVTPEMEAKIAASVPLAPLPPTMGDMPEAPPEDEAEQGPEIIAENDPEGRQPGSGDDPIDIPEYLKTEATEPTFPTLTSDRPMTIEEVVAAQGLAVTDVAQAPPVPSAPAVESVPEPEPPPPIKPSILARIEEEQAAGRAILERKRAELEHNKRVQAAADAREKAAVEAAKNK